MLTAEEAYAVAMTIRADVGPKPIRERPEYDRELMEKLATCWVFEAPPDPEVIGTSVCVAVDKRTGKAFSFGFGE